MYSCSGTSTTGHFWQTRRRKLPVVLGRERLVEAVLRHHLAARENPGGRPDGVPDEQPPREVTRRGGRLAGDDLPLGCDRYPEAGREPCLGGRRQGGHLALDLRLVPPVVVEEGDELPIDGIQPGVHRGCRAAVRSVLDAAHPVVTRGQFGRVLRRRAVVDDHDPEGVVGLL